MTGRFITVEGLEGVGKSTQIHFIRRALEETGHEVIVTREPGGTPLAERIRDVVLDPGGEAMSPECELLLMFAARSLHLQHVIQPALRRGAWVVSDRFTDATYAYQGGGRGIDRAVIRWLEQLIHPDMHPDLTILLDTPIEDALQRAEQRNVTQGRTDRFEQERLVFFERVRNTYLDLARSEPERFAVIDARGSVQAVSEKIAVTLQRLI